MMEKRIPTEQAYREGYADCMARHARTLTVGEMDNGWNNSVAKNGIPGQKLTEDDKNSIRYFIIEKQDITRWCGWEDKKTQAFIEFPELSNALLALTGAEDDLTRIANKIGDCE